MNTKAPASDDVREMARILKSLARAERSLATGVTLEDALTQLQISREQFEADFDQYAAPPNGAESLSSSSVDRSVVPVFHENAEGEMEHLGEVDPIGWAPNWVE
jgi:hypothetical protein